MRRRSKKVGKGKRWQKQRISNSDNDRLERIHGEALEIIAARPEDFGFSKVTNTETNIQIHMVGRDLGVVDLIVKTAEGEVYVVQCRFNGYRENNQILDDELAQAVGLYRMGNPEIDPEKVRPYIIHSSDPKYRGLFT